MLPAITVRPPINLQTEVHERPDSYGREHNLLMLVPHEKREMAEVYFLRDGCFVAQQSVSLQHPPPKNIQRKIRSVYFSNRRTRRKDREPWEREIIFRWLAANRRRLNYIDIDEAGDFATVVGRLTCYLNDPGKLSDKIYYR